MLEGPGLPWDVHAQLQLHSGAGVQEQPVRVLLCTHVLQGRRGRHRCQLVHAPTLSWLHQGGAGRRLCVCVRVYVCVCVGGGGGWGVRGTALGIAVHVLVKIPTHAATASCAPSWGGLVLATQCCHGVTVSVRGLGAGHIFMHDTVPGRVRQPSLQMYVWCS